MTEYEYRMFVPDGERAIVQAMIDRLKTEAIRYESHRIISIEWLGNWYIDMKIERFDDRPAA
jgi:hypothetical protein